MKNSDGFLQGVGGLRLYYRAWEVPRARSTIAVVHGLGEHSARYEAFAQRMAAYSFSTFALDLRGHGLSEGRRGHVRRFENFFQDVDRFRREIQGVIDVGTPLFLLGHSMGGLIALRYLEEFDSPFRGGIIVSPWLATAMPVPRWKMTLANALNRILPAVPFNSGLDIDKISRDPAIVQAYRDDPLVHSYVTPRLFSEVSAAMGLVLQRSDRIRIPLLFLLAGDDHLTSTQRSESFARSLAVRDVTIETYEKAYHEVLNEPDHSAALHDLRSWIATRLSSGMPKRQQSAAPPLHGR